MMLKDKNLPPVILFDGYCNFCNSSVNFIIRHDKKNYFSFAALQHKKGRQLLKKFNGDNLQTSTIVLIEDDVVYTKSTALLKIAKHLNGLYPLVCFLLIVPPFIRNGVYDFIARNRYKWFGKQEVCMVPSDEIKAKFIL